MNATSALGWSLLHFLWQGALIALAAKPRPVDAAAPSCTCALRRGGRSAGPHAADGCGLAGAYVLRLCGAAVARARTRCGGGARAARDAGGDRPREPSAKSIEALDEAQIASSFPSSALALSTRPWKQRVTRVPAVDRRLRGRWRVVALAARLLASYSAVRRLVRAQSESEPRVACKPCVARLSRGSASSAPCARARRRSRTCPTVDRLAGAR